MTSKEIAGTVITILAASGATGVVVDHNAEFIRKQAEDCNGQLLQCAMSCSDDQALNWFRRWEDSMKGGDG